MKRMNRFIRYLDQGQWADKQPLGEWTIRETSYIAQGIYEETAAETHERSLYRVLRFLEVAGMSADEPSMVANRIVKAIVDKRKDVTIGAAERLYSRVNALFPRLIDAGLYGTTAKARALFSE